LALLVHHLLPRSMANPVFLVRLAFRVPMGPHRPHTWVAMLVWVVWVVLVVPAPAVLAVTVVTVVPVPLVEMQVQAPMATPVAVAVPVAKVA
jgi:hypothetical protein